jgi:hypothetical protein
VGCPTGVSDTELACGRTGLEDFGEAFVDFAFLLPQFETPIAHECHAGAVVPPILKAPQPFQDHWTGLLLADIADDSTHKFKLENATKRHAAECRGSPVVCTLRTERLWSKKGIPDFEVRDSLSPGV